MDNVFQDAVANSTNAADNTNLEENAGTGIGSELGSEYDLDLESLYAENSADDVEDTADVDSGDEGTPLATNDNPTNHAFQQMRTQNKEYSDKLNELDAIAKAAGLKDVDDLIAQSKAAQIKREAKNQGISENLARELAEFREFKARTEQKQIQDAIIAKENTLAQNVKEFIDSNGLTQESINKLSDNLVKDGLTNDKLMDLPKSALIRILGSYTNSNTQKNLAQKDAIRNELPLNQSSKVDNQTVNKQIDDFARYLAGKN